MSGVNGESEGFVSSGAHDTCSGQFCALTTLPPIVVWLFFDRKRIAVPLSGTLFITNN